ncbi:zona pellucida sperm-binding protein 4-like [Alosa pseudoharengus]|uniref:zona pellucida sperm-binding protein 4-like n=1 Tax=Alosa pseudoharengus TaxID=34774 RepID=UPI003F89DD1B
MASWRSNNSGGFGVVLLIWLGLYATGAQYVSVFAQGQSGQTPRWSGEQKSGAEPPSSKCAVSEDERLQCGDPDITAADCEAIDCCFEQGQCFYGRAVTVQCTKDGQFVVVVAKAATLPQLSLESIALLEGEEEACSPIGFMETYVILQFPVSACGTSVTEQNGYVVYENVLSSAYEVAAGPHGLVTRDSSYELLFQCRYSDTAVEALVVEVNTLPPPESVVVVGPLRVELKLGSGQCLTKGCVEDEEAYTSYYTEADYPVTKTLRQPVYVEVHVLERTDPNIVLQLGACWATSSPSPLRLPKWDLLVNGCPYDEDRYQTTMLPVTSVQYPTHYKRFAVKMFTFVDGDTYLPLKEKVFIHCSTAVCYPSAMDSCEHACHRQRRDVSAQYRTKASIIVSSSEVLVID